MRAEQLDLFQQTYEPYRISKPIRLIELFAGIGAQSKALEILGVPFESHKVVEWSCKSIIGYNAIHKGDYSDYANGASLDALIDKVIGVSMDYNQPMGKEQLKRKGEKWLKRLYSSMVAINDLCPDVSRLKGADLAIERERERAYCYIMTYSFPCQDLSSAGLRKGMSDQSTRSGLLWEVERVLRELRERQERPDILIMENVAQVHGNDSCLDWERWLQALEGMGYANYFKDLNSKDYGIPQNRVRCFCVSVLKGSNSDSDSHRCDYGYAFPQGFKLRYKLKDFESINVDERYYLSDKIIKTFTKDKDGYPRSKQFKASCEASQKGIANTLTTGEGSRPNGTYIVTSNGYHLYEPLKLGSYKNDNWLIGDNGVSKTLLTSQDATRGFWVKEEQKEKIRKLTPYECARLMGFETEDFIKMSEAGLAESALYHSAGDSIATTVLVAIIGKLVGMDDKAIQSKIEGYVENRLLNDLR